MHEAEEEEVVSDEVGRDGGGCSEGWAVRGVERVKVEQLVDEEEEPEDGGDDGGLRKGGGIVVVPDAAVWMVAFMRLVEGVVEGCHQQNKVGYGCGDFIQEEGLAGGAI